MQASDIVAFVSHGGLNDPATTWLFPPFMITEGHDSENQASGFCSLLRWHGHWTVVQKNRLYPSHVAPICHDCQYPVQWQPVQFHT